MVMVVDKNTEVIKYNNLTFILYGKNIIIKTPLQAFYLCSNECWKTAFTNKRMRYIRLMIQLGEIRSLNELAGYTRPGIKWTATGINYDVSECKIKVIPKSKRRISNIYEYDV